MQYCAIRLVTPSVEDERNCNLEHLDMDIIFIYNLYNNHSIFILGIQYLIRMIYNIVKDMNTIV